MPEHFATAVSWAGSRCWARDRSPWGSRKNGAYPALPRFCYSCDDAGSPALQLGLQGRTCSWIALGSSPSEARMLLENTLLQRNHTVKAEEKPSELTFRNEAAP